MASIRRPSVTLFDCPSNWRPFRRKKTARTLSAVRLLPSANAWLTAIADASATPSSTTSSIPSYWNNHRGRFNAPSSVASLHPAGASPKRRIIEPWIVTTSVTVGHQIPRSDDKVVTGRGDIGHSLQSRAKPLRDPHRDQPGRYSSVVDSAGREAAVAPRRARAGLQTRWSTAFGGIEVADST